MRGNIKMDVKRKEKGVNLIHLAQYKDKLWAFVNIVLKFDFYKMYKLSTLSDELAVSYEGLCSLEIVDYLVG
jgi:hypothetical protein